MDNNQVENPTNKRLVILLIVALVIALIITGFLVYQNYLLGQRVIQKTTQNYSPTILEPREADEAQKLPKTVLSFETVSKSTNSQVLGDTSDAKETIPVQVFAFEDHNGNGVREPDDQALTLMPISIYDSPFSTTPVKQINSTDSGWASVQQKLEHHIY
jgi:hypothetical protein